jgi:hypothetical protein
MPDGKEIGTCLLFVFSQPGEKDFSIYFWKTGGRKNNMGKPIRCQ